MDKMLISRQFSKSLQSYNSEAQVQKLVAAKLAELIFEYSENFLGKVFELGCGTGLLTEHLLKNFFIDEVILNDLTQGAEEFALDLFERYPKSKMSFSPADAEAIHFPQDCNLICSSSTIQWFSNLPEFFKKAANSLLPSGILAVSTYGIDNFKEIKSIGFKGLEYIEISELESLVSTNFEVLYKFETEEKQYFDSPNAVLKHFKNTGVNGLSRVSWTKQTLETFISDYSKKFSEEGKVYLTYHPVYLILKKK